mgnify:FL=1
MTSPTSASQLASRVVPFANPFPLEPPMSTDPIPAEPTLGADALHILEHFKTFAGPHPWHAGTYVVERDESWLFRITEAASGGSVDDALNTLEVVTTLWELERTSLGLPAVQPTDAQVEEMAHHAITTMRIYWARLAGERVTGAPLLELQNAGAPLWHGAQLLVTVVGDPDTLDRLPELAILH